MEGIVPQRTWRLCATSSYLTIGTSSLWVLYPFLLNG
ncbi:rCG50572, partial [Rattus norvegicus]